METTQKTKPHPLSPLILEMAAQSQMLDVSTVFCALSGTTSLLGSRAKEGTKAYRLVAVDVLEYMTDQGILTQVGEWSNSSRKECGGPSFVLA